MDVGTAGGASYLHASSMTKLTRAALETSPDGAWAERASLRTVDGTVKADEGTDSLAEASLSTDEGGNGGGGAEG